MNWLLNVGDADVMRDATSASTVFWYRARRAGTWLSIGAAPLALLLIAGALLVAGPGGGLLAFAQRDVMAVTVAVLAVLCGLYGGWLFFKFTPSRNDRIVLSLRDFVRGRVDPVEAALQGLSDDELKARTAEFRERLARGESIDDIRAEAYACVREASRRARAHRQFECQLIGGRVIEGCNVAEMRTGEGKTIVCYMANYLKVLQGLKVHMVTVNDYLVKRDADFCRPIFELLGVTVGNISADMPVFGDGAEIRRAAYGCDITYGTNSEFGFDYLRDNMKQSRRDQMQGKQDFVVVDEVDSILIDEARTPLIISGAAHDDVTNYRVADNIARLLLRKQEQSNKEMALRIDDVEATADKDTRADAKFKDGIKKFRTDPLWLSSEEAEAIGHTQYFVVELDRKSAHMTEHGAKIAQQELAIGTFYDSKNMNWPHYIDNSLRAHTCYQRDKEYVVQEDIVTIVDEFTGRLMTGRQWSDGLHQAVEAKERVTIKQETQTLATITLQNLFKLYKQLAGMTGTAMTEADEFMKIYRLEVVAIPTNKPVRRVDYNDKIYKTGETKYDAIVEEIRSYSQNGYPADPWSLHDMLKHAEKTLREQLHARPELQAEIDPQLATINTGISAFKNGEGDEKALETAYQQLMGDSLKGRPILVGTTSVENSEKLSQLLTRRYGIDHEVLNAKNHAREAEIVAKAGQLHEVVRSKQRFMQGNVTIATNMAGRGTDIRLAEGVPDAGGLHVVGTERHESRRIDNQLRGRCGRQGDPGSSRFFLSLDDELLRLFMGEWVLRMLNMLGFEEGMAIEDKRLNKGIERAQKKVEERNFAIRKNLLEYDEVMDYQRKTFYSLRQRVVEGRDLSVLIWDMIDEVVADAVHRFYDPLYAATCIVEWVNQHVGVQIEAEKLETKNLDLLQEQVRDLAAAEMRSHVQRVFGEYIDPGSPAEEWDVRGLSSWASQYGLSVSQAEVRKGDPEELFERIIAAAEAKVRAEDMAALEQYVDPLFPKARLVRWAKDKFEVEIPLDEIARVGPEDADRTIREKMRAAYRIREIEYPVGAVIEFAMQRGGQNATEVLSRIAAWANRKFGFDWTYEHFSGKTPQEVFRELREVNEQFLYNGRFDAEIDKAIQENPDAQIIEWARKRFGTALEGNPIRLDGDLREQLKRAAYEMLRFELTQLERYVMLNTFDSVWKDHMYAMDLLRSGIWLRGQAERDPKIEYKREGTRLFNEMNANIRERVTDLIFKVHLMAGGGGAAAPGAAPTPDAGTAYGRMQTAKADATGAGFSAADRDRDAAMQKQGEAGAKVDPIKRATPKVGRNDPCPCGSGKKYKQCHGKGA
ncbi:preprotein translocase subunit SecA [Phycisphaerae bacterium RAS1]|nr:preprotein translocase subunit SecA [Phycisphaerae bacterium RAS1]